MRPVKKNLTTMYYALFSTDIPILDDEGNPTFETRSGYLEPVKFKACISEGYGSMEAKPFGADISYDRVIVVYDLLPIDEYTLIWVDREPVMINGEINPDSADYEVSGLPLKIRPDGRKWITERIPVKRRVM